ncbi:MAG: glycosyltransferase family 39 protein [Deltaproteobacteria bacterium]|nr:glycosyltransferase family 39 protein [Deltaproteobacteria bacterium]
MPWRLALGLAGLSLGAHLGVALLTEPVPDEAYYLLWSRHLAWDYPDHPPAVAFFLALARLLAGEGRLALRLPALLTALLVPTLLGWALARTRGEAEARRLLWLLHATLLLHVLGVIVTPDTPLSLAWAAALAGLLLLVDREGEGRPAPLLLLGVGLALGVALLSKLTGWALLGGVLAAALFHRPLRERLGGWGGLALLVVPALALAAPWIAATLAAPGESGLAFQLGRLSPRGSLPAKLGAYLGGQLGVLTPGVLWLALRFAGTLRRPASPRDTLLLWLGLPLPLFFLAVALVRPVEANWIGPAWLPLLVGAAGLPVTRRCFRGSVGVGLGLVLLLHGLALATASEAGRGLLPRASLARLSGGERLAARVDELCSGPVVRVGDYGAGAELHLHLGAERVRVETRERPSLFDRLEQPPFVAVDGACSLDSCRRPPPPLEGCVWGPPALPGDWPRPRLCLSRLRCEVPLR